MEYPAFIPFVSALQILVHFVKIPGKTIVYLEFDPLRRFEIGRFLTPVLIHSGNGDEDQDVLSCLHLWSNLLFQILLGWKLEAELKWKNTAFIYFTSALFGSLASSAWKPCSSFGVGSSDAVCGLAMTTLAGHLMMGQRCLYLRWKSMWLFILGWIGQIAFHIVTNFELASLFSSDEAAHYGGAIGGFAAGLLVWKSRSPSAVLSRRLTLLKMNSVLISLFLTSTMLFSVFYAVMLYSNVPIKDNFRSILVGKQQYEYVAGLMCNAYWYNTTSYLKTFGKLLHVLQRDDPNEISHLLGLRI